MKAYLQAATLQVVKFPHLVVIYTSCTWELLVMVTIA